MNVVATVLPVFVMIGLGLAARVLGWVTDEQAQGVKQLTFGILFPVMIFNALFTAGVPEGALGVIGFTLAIRVAALAAGWAFGRAQGGAHGHLLPYLFPTNDGGNVVFPLYATIVGASYIGNIVLLDLSCMVVAFLVIPVMVEASRGTSLEPAALVRSVITNPTVIVMVAGFVLNVAGVYAWLSTTPLLEVYTGVANMITGPIVALVLWTIGYDLKLDARAVAQIAPALLAREVVMGLATVALLMLFPQMAADPQLRIAFLLYFPCAPMLATPAVIAPVCTEEGDAAYVSGFLSLAMVVSIAWYLVVMLVFV